MAGHGGGAWKVAYADFVTAMMAFFLVMWIVAQNKPVKEAVARYFNDPYGTSTKPGRSSILVPDPNGSNPPGGSSKTKGPKGVPNPDPTARLITDPEPADATSKKPSLLALHTGRDAYVGTVIAFDETSAELNNQAKRRLKDLVPDLLGKPNKIELRGHTSGRRLPKNSPFADPWQLSYARSQATMRFLAEQGVEPRRFRLSQSAGFEPKSIGLGAEAQAQNARVEIYMLGELADDLVGTRDERDNRLKNRQMNPKAPPKETGNKE